MAGRPTNWSEELEQQAWEYIENYQEYGHKVPMVVGLCKVINRSKSTIYEWAEKGTGQFPDIVRAIGEKQELELCNNGLSGGFNASITKLMLTKHGYSDRVDATQDTNVNVNIVEFKDDETD